MSLLSPFARAKRWTNTDSFKMSVDVTVKHISLHNAFDASASYLSVAVARGSKRFKTLKAVWSEGTATWNQTIPLTCTLFQDKLTGEFQSKIYRLLAEEARDKRRVANFVLDVAQLAAGMDGGSREFEASLQPQKPILFTLSFEAAHTLASLLSDLGMTHADFVAMNLELSEKIISEVGGHELTDEGIEAAGEALEAAHAKSPADCDAILLGADVECIDRAACLEVDVRCVWLDTPSAEGDGSPGGGGGGPGGGMMHDRHPMKGQDGEYVEGDQLQALVAAWPRAELELSRDANGNLGLGLESHGEPPHAVILVEQLLEGGAAEQHGGIGVGDALVSVGKEDTTSMSFERVVAAMAQWPTPGEAVPMTFGKPPPGEGLYHDDDMDNDDDDDDDDEDGGGGGDDDGNNGGRFGGGSDDDDDDDDDGENGGRFGGGNPKLASPFASAAANAISPTKGGGGGGGGGGAAGSAGGAVVDASEGFSKLSADLLACRKAMEACEEELPACPTRVRTALMTSYEAAVLAQHTLMASRERERELVEEVETRRQEGGAFREQLMAARRKATRLARDAEKGGAEKGGGGAGAGDEEKEEGEEEDQEEEDQEDDGGEEGAEGAEGEEGGGGGAALAAAKRSERLLRRQLGREKKRSATLLAEKRQLSQQVDALRENPQAESGGGGGGGAGGGGGGGGLGGGGGAAAEAKIARLQRAVEAMEAQRLMSRANVDESARARDFALRQLGKTLKQLSAAQADATALKAGGGRQKRKQRELQGENTKLRASVEALVARLSGAVAAEAGGGGGGGDAAIVAAAQDAMSPSAEPASPAAAATTPPPAAAAAPSTPRSFAFGDDEDDDEAPAAAVAAAPPPAAPAAVATPEPALAAAAATASDEAAATPAAAEGATPAAESSGEQRREEIKVSHRRHHRAATALPKLHARAHTPRRADRRPALTPHPPPARPASPSPPRPAPPQAALRDAVAQFASDPLEVWAQFAEKAQPGAGGNAEHGFISRSGFKTLLMSMGIEASDHDRKAIRKSLDANDDKKVWWSEFKAFLDEGAAAGAAGAAADAEAAAAALAAEAAALDAAMEDGGAGGGGGIAML